jgi:hypothetical protein
VPLFGQELAPQLIAVTAEQGVIEIKDGQSHTLEGRQLNLKRNAKL